jgi:hypothetical protein
MAQQVTADAGLLTIYKIWYTEKGVENLLFRNSPTLKKIKKERIGGREYAFSMLYGRGGACSGDYTLAVAYAAASGAANAEMRVPPGNLFSVFNITQKEKLASVQKKGAYTPALIDKMMAATEAFRKQLAAALFGMGFGEIGLIPAAGVIAGAATFTFAEYSPIVKIDVGTRFEVATAVPNGALLAGGPFTVTGIDGLTITYTPVTPAGGWAGADVVEFAGSRDGAGAPNVPTGLAGWIPHYLNRTGAPWLAYIATAFYGVNRSVSVQKLAGQFYQAVALESDESAIVNLIKLIRSAGGVPDMVVINPDNYKRIIDNLALNVNYMQQINTPQAKGGANEYQVGLSTMGFQYSTNWIQYVYEDPYCPFGVAWVLDSEAIKLVSLSNTETPVGDGIEGVNPGTQSVDAVAAPDVDQYKFIIDDFLDVRPGADTAEGPAARVTISGFMNFVVTNPAHCGVVRFLP